MVPPDLKLLGLVEYEGGSLQTQAVLEANWVCFAFWAKFFANSSIKSF